MNNTKSRNIEGINYLSINKYKTETNLSTFINVTFYKTQWFIEMTK